MAVSLTQEFCRAAAAIAGAKALLITAGAGMGVDSGLPDFRGPQGFWKAYPPLKKLGIQLAGMSNPRWFHEDPEFAWGFFGHRYNLYTKATPHDGFQILREWGENMELGYFVFTSNVDGHFQKAGFAEEKVVECHGSINYMQCVDGIEDAIWPVPEGITFTVDEDILRAKAPLPMGPPPMYNQPARPNILMFGDFEWVGNRQQDQMKQFHQFTSRLPFNEPFVVIEIGAGLAVPTVRYQGEGLVAKSRKATLIRINPREPEVPGDAHISLPIGGLEALRAIRDLL